MGIVNFVNSVKEERGFDGLIYKHEDNKILDISVWNRRNLTVKNSHFLAKI